MKEKRRAKKRVAVTKVTKRQKPEPKKDKYDPGLPSGALSWMEL